MRRLTKSGPGRPDRGAEFNRASLARLKVKERTGAGIARRLAELMKPEIPVPQSAALEIGYGRPPKRPKGIALQIAEKTGLSKDTVHRAALLITISPFYQYHFTIYCLHEDCR